MSIYRCPGCGFQYDESRGDPHEGLRPGTRWSSLPQDTVCPGCAVRERDDFELLDEPRSGAAG
ncbi:MAG TPA: rubredoxin [Burkholderiaceae bacterium]|nr:rubredoxin [Burkholderiaceae bacterium]